MARAARPPRAVRSPGQLSELEFEERFRAFQAARGVRFSRRGCRTVYVVYLGLCRRQRGCGEWRFETTNAQRATAMRQLGRERCERTVQRAHRLLGAMGLAAVEHVRRGGATAGFRDCLRVRIIASFVTPPFGGQRRGLRPTPPLPRTALSAPPAAAGGRPPPLRGGGNGNGHVGNEEEEPDEATRARWIAQAAVRIAVRRARFEELLRGG